MRMVGFADKCNSPEIREAAVRTMLSAFKGTAYSSAALAALNFRPLLRLVSSGELRAKSEEVRAAGRCPLAPAAPAAAGTILCSCHH